VQTNRDFLARLLQRRGVPVVDIIPGGPEALELEGRMTAEEVQQALWLLDASMPVVVSCAQCR
jgi:CheY-like chemotaxis protein